MSGPVSVRVQLPYHLRNLAGVDGEIRVELPAEGGSRPGASDPPTQDEGGGTSADSELDATGARHPTVADLLDALEARFPSLRGTIRDHGGPRRAYLRFFTCGEDISHQGEAFPLPKPVVEGREVFRVVGAISGG